MEWVSQFDNNYKNQKFKRQNESDSEEPKIKWWLINEKLILFSWNIRVSQIFVEENSFWQSLSFGRYLLVFYNSDFQNNR